MANEVSNLRRRTVASIRRMATPHFYDSGYRTTVDRRKGLLAGSRPYRLFAFKGALRIGGYVVDDLLAVTEDGLMTDAYGGGCVTTGFGGVPVEDLLKIEVVLAKHFSQVANREAT